jgi:hypothetical protein
MMTAMPQARRALVDAAHRYYHDDARVSTAPSRTEVPRPTRWLPRALVGRMPLIRWGAAGVAAVVAAAVVASLVVGTSGGGPAQAFARWTARPTRAAAGQLQAAESACAVSPTVASLTPTLVDTRGPYSMLVYVQPSMTVVCISGGARTVFTEGRAPSTRSIPPGTIKPQGGIFSTSVRFLTGQVGPSVTGVTLILDDGRSVQATTQKGWFAAWWPNLQGVQSAELTTATGTKTRPLHLPLNN